MSIFASEKKSTRQARRKLAKQQPQHSMSNPLVFETFEPRVLMDATLPIAPLAVTPSNGTTLASDSQPATVQDADGTKITVAIAGNGHWQITQQTLAPVLTITGTDLQSKVTISTAGGDGLFLLYNIDLENAAASVTGKGVTLDGGLTLKGAVGSLALGALTVDANSTVNIAGAASDTTGALKLSETTTGTLNLTGGSSLSSGPTIVGDQTGASGSAVNVSGTGSLWQVNGGLTLGNAVNGTQLNVSGKGLVVTDTLDVGAQSTGGGTVARAIG